MRELFFHFLFTLRGYYMKTLLMVFPHCSTGGMPEYARKKIEILRDVYDIYVVEYSNYGDSYIVSWD